MHVALQLAALAAGMLALGLIVRFAQMRLRMSYLAGRVAASMAGIITFPPLMQWLGARSGNELRTSVMGGVFGYAGYWLAVKLWHPLGTPRRRRR